MTDSRVPAQTRIWHVLCDFDHTITTEDLTDGLLTRFANPAWDWLERAWREGHIDARDCMAAQIALLKAAPHELDSYLDSVEIDPDFVDFAAFCLRSGVGLEIVSDGLDYAVHRVLQRHGLAHLPVTANHLHRLDHGRWAVRLRHAGDGCHGRQGVCKCAVAEAAAPRVHRLLIGDGRSDFCVARQVDFVFAKHGLLTHCRENGVAHHSVANFGQALPALQQLLAESLPMLATAPPAYV